MVDSIEEIKELLRMNNDSQSTMYKVLNEDKVEALEMSLIALSLYEQL